MKKKALLVGMHFRPPAKQLLGALLAGAELILEPEPENPYDPEAVMVLVKSEQIQPEQLNEEELLGMGQTLESIQAEETWHLGYLAREGNKQLEKMRLEQPLASAGQILQLLGEPGWTAKLAWGPNSEALVEVQNEN